MDDGMKEILNIATELGQTKERLRVAELSSEKELYDAREQLRLMTIARNQAVNECKEAEEKLAANLKLNRIGDE